MAFLKELWELPLRVLRAVIKGIEAPIALRATGPRVLCEEGFITKLLWE